MGAGGWEFESLRPDPCEVVELVPRLALNQEVRVRTVASQPTDDACAVSGRERVTCVLCCLVPRPINPIPVRCAGRAYRRADTYEGGRAFVRDAESELFLLAATNMVGEGTFYERAAGRDARFVDLVHEVAVANPAFVAGTDPDAGRVG